MRFLDYLFFKYYHFQKRVGNGDIAPLMSVLFICFVLEFYYLCIYGTYYLFFSSAKPPSWISSSYAIITVNVVNFVVLYFLFLFRKRYKKVLKNHETEWKGKKNIGAIIFAVCPFAVFFVGLYIKMLMNQGKI
jgi:hypothetical protein